MEIPPKPNSCYPFYRGQKHFFTLARRRPSRVARRVPLAPALAAEALTLECTLNDLATAAWPELAAALVRHAQENEVAEVEQTRHGVRYVVDGPAKAPDGRTLNIRCAWYIDTRSETPRFVTAHPLPKL